MSEQKKTITINPDLFKIPGGKKAVKKPKNESIKIKQEIHPSYIKSKTLKNRALKLIRAKQQEEYKRLFNDESRDLVHEPQKSTNTFTANFNSSFNYLKQLSDKVEQINAPLVHNSTIKQYSPVSVTENREPVISTTLPAELFGENSNSSNTTNVHINPGYQGHQIHPGYGCMKGGKYPTYRTWKNYSPLQNIPQTNNNNYQTNNNNQIYSAPNFTTNTIANTNPVEKEKEKEKEKEIRSDDIKDQEMTLKRSASSILLQQIQQKKNIVPATKTEKHNYRIRNRRRRKIFNRTYRVGKNSVSQKIGCLISNKTIRQKIQQKCYEIKNIDMKEIRKYLLKHGFIKIGTTAPNDVLRKMYESIVTICGEVENHNSEILLHNFLNDEN